MSSKDIYNRATVYNPVAARTQAPQHNHTSRPAAPLSSSRQSSSIAPGPHTNLERDNKSSDGAYSLAAPKPYTTLERDNNSTPRASLSRLLEQHTALRKDGQNPASHNHTLLNRDQRSSSSSRQPTIMGAAATTAPSDAKSRFKTQHDINMASRQVKYQEMNHEEKKKQDEWVRDFIQYAGPCPAGFSWERVKYGYVCNGGNHLCTDDLLAEGKGGFYMGTLDAGWWGPTYDANILAQIKYTETKVWEYAKKHGLDPTIAPVIPEPDLPASGEIHPGIAKAMAGLGPMPQARSIEETHGSFTIVGYPERLGLPTSPRSYHTPAGLSHHSSGVPHQLSTLYGPGGLPNRLAMNMGNGSLSQAGQIPHGLGLPSYMGGPSGGGLCGNGFCGHHRH
ncbi:3d89c326-aeca-43f5-983c-06a98bf3dc09 [Sclerotinia trifoliorum]|uniref:3d89c326-aeca-43f5-983c-06a98bf3dc09 n=1 Tax=Sclerotinia trifoliorum TaxID=28548 RepID=A0A8H2VTZ0_9HELO|nr:3d89c326-aeca-43f5-983c-06a98bf3dc09 [Sclerotinia trifoliorum]